MTTAIHYIFNKIITKILTTINLKFYCSLKILLIQYISLEKSHYKYQQEE